MSVRVLPTSILRPEAKYSSDAASVQKKYSSSLARVGEGNVDYEALRLLLPEAALFWLPAFIEYLKSDASEDSFHFESLLAYLSDLDICGEWKDMATKEETELASNFLHWLSGSTSFLNGSKFRQEQHRLALTIWAGDNGH